MAPDAASWPGPTLPPRLWAAAEALVPEHGVYGTARALGLSYGALKRHVENQDGSATRVGAHRNSWSCRARRSADRASSRSTAARAIVRVRFDGLPVAGGGRFTRLVVGRLGMIQITPQMRILVAIGPAGFSQKASMASRGAVGRSSTADPFSGGLFVFRNRGWPRCLTPLFMTARASGWPTSVFRRDIFAGGRRVRTATTSLEAHQLQRLIVGGDPAARCGARVASDPNGIREPGGTCVLRGTSLCSPAWRGRSPIAAAW